MPGRSSLALMVFALSLPGQHLIQYDTVMMSYAEAMAVSPGWPAGSPPGAPFPGTGLLMPMVGPVGDVTVDDMRGLAYATDGVMIEAVNLPGYAPLSVPPIPFPKPPILSGPLTGIAVDPAAGPGGVLYCTDGLSFVAISASAPHVTMIPLWGTAGIPGGVVALERDPWSGLLFGVDAGGTIWNLPVGLSGPSFPMMGPPWAPPGLATGLAFDKSFGPFPVTGVYVAFGPLVIEYSGLPWLGTGAPIVLPGGGISNAIAFHAKAAILPGASGCALAAPTPVLATNSPVWSGNASFAMTLSGVPAGSPLLLLVETNPANPLVPGGLPMGLGGALYIDVFTSPTAYVIPFGAMPAGPLTFAANLVGAPIGLKLYVQWAFLCPGWPYLGLSDALQVFVGPI